MEYTRYFGLILGITGSFLTFVYSTVKKHDLKKFIEKNLQLINMDEASVKQQFAYLNEETKIEVAKVGAQINQLTRLINQDRTIMLKETPNPFSFNNMDPLEDPETKMWLKVVGGLAILYILLRAIGG